MVDSRGLKMGEKKVVYITGPPGSGKTDYLYKNLKEIIKSKKAKPEEILFFTFNDKIAEELKEKIIKWTEEGFAELWINSFSSFCKKILRDNYYQLSALPQKTFLGPNFQIIGGMEERLVLKRILEETSLNLKFYAKAKSSVFFINEMVNFVDLMKQNLHKLERLKDEGGKFAELEKIFYKYNTQLHKSDYLDLRDLTLQTIDLFKGRKDVFETYKNKFKYVLVDDFEDIDYQQFRLLQILADEKSNLIIAGNVSESIFSFRGARPEEIKKKFIQQFNPQVINISSKPNISPVEILPYKFDTGKEESFFIARRIYKLIREKNKKGEALCYKDFLVLSRDIGKEVDSLVNALSFYRIPCTVLGGTGFFKQPAIISLISVLQVIYKFKKKTLSNFHIIWALTTLNFCIDKVDMERLVTLSEKKNKNLLEIFGELKNSSFPYLKTRTRDILAEFVEKIKEFQQSKTEKSLEEILYKIYLDFGFLLQSRDDKKIAGQLNYFNEIIKKYQRIENRFSGKKLDFDKFMENLQGLMSSYGRELGVQLEEEEDAVKIMTVQQAKGKFFKVVFVTGLVEGKFPRQYKEDILLNNKEKEFLGLKPLIKSVEYIKEEEKIFQVALSRARNMLYLTCAKRYDSQREQEISGLLLDFLEKEGKNFLSVDEGILTYDDLLGLLLRDGPNMELEECLKKDKNKFLFYQWIKEKYSLANLYDKVELPQNFYFTPSKIKTYLDCPAKFFFRYCLNIFSPPQPALFLGIVIHHILELFHKEYVTPAQLQDKAIARNLDGIVRKVWREEAKNFETKFEKKIYEQEIYNILARYLKLEKTRTFLKTSKCEVPFEWETEGFHFRGRIDRIDIKEDYSCELIDYKTTKTFAYQGDTLWDKWIKGKTDFQPVIYLLGAKGIVEDKVCSFSIYWLKKKTGNDFKTTLRILTDGEREPDKNKKQIKCLSTSELEEAKESLLQISREIMEGEYKPKQGFNTCKNCDFRWLCESWGPG